MTEPTTRVDLHGFDSASWHRIDTILDQVFDLPTDELEAALERLCPGNEELQKQIRSILAADREVEGYLSRTARQELIEQAAGLELELPPLEGRVLGAWRVLHEVGRGGMSSVYLGERADGAFEQRVAIKFLGRGIASPEVLARFRQERQILARLEHPNIAHLVDGGVTEDGLWWFAMEYVDGSPITTWCAAHRLATREVLELFQQACRAVQYAHRNLVVHRDLKPSNILVSEAGEVKLLDFGIAKILAPEESGADASLVTTAAMTPNYAAPEQIRGEPPTTATDVYALGVVLYELLTGARPYRRKTGTLEEVRRAVLDQEPEAPSARSKRAAREARGGRRERSAGAAREGDARQDVNRELDNIVLTAMRKEPERRYSSVEALSDDLERYLDGRPVRASGRTFGYLASKLIRKNRVPVAAAALALVALLAGLFVTARERDRARLEAAKATQLKEFALSLFRVSNPEEGRGESITARELLDRGAARVEHELKGNPRVQAEMWDLLGSVYKSLDLFPRAVAMYEKSVAARRAMGSDPDTLLAGSLRELGSSLYENGNYAAGEKYLREALAIERRAYGAIDQHIALTTAELAVLKDRLGATAEAESLARHVIHIDTLTVGVNHQSTATDLANLGMHYYYDGRYKEAIPWISRALAIRERLLGRRHIETATGIDQLGMALAGAGETEAGLALMREALDVRRQWLAPDHPDIAHSYMNMGTALAGVGELPEAERDLRRALAIRAKSTDPKDPTLAQTHNDLAVVFYREGKLDSAGIHFNEALRIWAYSLPLDHNDVLSCRNNLAVIYRETGRYDESERLLRAILVQRVRNLGPDHMDVSYTEYHLGRLLVMSRRPAEGEPLLRRALATRRAALEDDDPRVAEVRLTLGNGLVAMGRVREGRALIHQSLEPAEKRLGPKDRMVVLARSQG